MSAKNEKIDKKSLAEKYHSFEWTQPVGYDFKAVEDTLEDYRQTIARYLEESQTRENYIAELEQEKDDLIKTITELRMELEAVTIQSQEPDKSVEILNKFAEQKDVFTKEDIEEDISDIDEKKASYKKLKTIE